MNRPPLSTRAGVGTESGPRPRAWILGVGIDAVDLDAAWARIAGWIAARQRAYVCVAPVSTIMSCQDDPDYRDLVNQADMVTPDGMPVVWLARRAGFSAVRRTYGPDLMRLACDRGQDSGCRHFFYGGTETVNTDLTAVLTAAYPRIVIAGQIAPPFRPLTPEEDARVIEEINRCRPDIVWVGLGSPKQDFWMARHRDKIDAPVMVGVGAAFDFLSGRKRQAPAWMQRSGLEWLFRLCCEPRRLGRRYLVGNTRFMYLLFRRGLARGGRAPGEQTDEMDRL